MNRYRPLDWLMVRAPLLPVEQYLALNTHESPTDARVRLALAVGGGDLWRALERQPASDRDRRRLAGKLQRYLIRMSTRPTPYGLFAGVGLATWGTRTDLAVGSGPARVRTRPDMGWLLDFVSTMEERPAVRAGLSWYANPTAFIRADRVFLSERAPIDEESTTQSMSLRATKAVRLALELAHTPVPYSDLLASLTELPGATPDKVKRLLDQLWEQTLLLTDLRPPLTTVEPARYVAERLARIPAAVAEAAALADLLDDLSAWDGLTPEQAVDAYPKLLAQAESVHTVERASSPFQTDMAMPLTGKVSDAVAAEAVRAADLLIRFSAYPNGFMPLVGYLEAFAGRYAEGQEVPLLELLDPELGLGPPAYDDKSDERYEERERTLTRLALEAIRDRRLVAELDDATVEKLTVEPDGSLPVSMDLSVFVTARSAEAIDKGDFQVVVGPNLGAPVAGRVLGRFAGMLGDDAVTALRVAADAEAAVMPDRTWLEVTYLPRRRRIANVATRPLVRDHELALNTTPGGAAIDPAHLVVSIHNGRFVVRRSDTGQEVLPCAGHMLTTRGGPAVARFLDEVSMAGQTLLTSFNWGPAAGYPFVPRIQSGRVVLSPATWRVPAKEFTPEWRARWQVPRHVYLVFADNRLLLDLADDSQLAQLPAKETLTLHEALPAPDHAWLPGPDGHHVSEIVVPLVRTTVEPASPRPPVAVTAGRRLRPPGSDWLYAKLYHLPTFENDLLVGPLRDVCADTGKWFFVRYADPKPHIRVRWTGDPGWLADELAPKVLRWGADLVDRGLVNRFALDTYDQEVERYGGPEAIPLAEDLFAADSVAVVELLSETDHDRTALGMYTVDDLLAGLGLAEDERIDLYQRATSDRKATAAAYRERQVELRTLIGRPHPDPAVRGILARRRAVVTAVAARLASLELVQSKLDIARSFVHMHCNRLLGCGHPPEQQVLGLLARTRESLARAPLG